MAALRVATRRSPLARWQATYVADRLRDSHGGLEVELVVIDTLGDRDSDRPIWDMGGRGVFVREVQAAVLEGRADVAVHSAKDLPANPALVPEGLRLVAVPERGDGRDALVGRPLHAIPPGGLVATGSVRRRAQLADLRPDLTFTGLRGNIGTRLAKAAAFSAIGVAAVALRRLGRHDRLAEVFDPAVMVPQVGQGALGVECRCDDDATAALVVGLDHVPSRRAVEAERAFLAALGEGCELPVGAHAIQGDDGRLELRAVLATLDGRVVLRDEVVGHPSQEPATVGRELAERMMETGGGRAVLAEVGPVSPRTCVSR